MGLDTLPNEIAKWNGTACSYIRGDLFEPNNVSGTHTLCLYGQNLIYGALSSTAVSAFNRENIPGWNEKVLAIISDP